MAFPATTLPVIVEAMINGAWEDITDESYTRDPIVITRGRANEGATVEASSAQVSLDNRDGRFSPRNPLSAYYGLIGRNTPCRISLQGPDSYLNITATTGDTPVSGAYLSAPDSAALSITGDIDIRFDADLYSWCDTMELVSKYNQTGGQRSYQFTLAYPGILQFWWSTAGTVGLPIESTQRVPIDTGRLAVRVTMDVNNGASGCTATFYTSDSLSGTWTQLGDPVTQSGTTSIFDSTAIATILDNPNSTLGGSIIRGRVYGAEIRNGINGTAVANPDFTNKTVGASSVTDAAGNTWTLHGAVEITDRDPRMHGEIASWPQSWDTSGKDVSSTVQVAGVLRRLGAGAAPLQSALRRSVLDTSPIAYWPCEDSSGSDQFGSAVTGGTPMTIKGTPNLASSSEFQCSSPLPQVAGSQWTGYTGANAGTGEAQYRFLFYSPVDAIPDNRVLARLFTTGTIRRWDIGWHAAGDMSVSWYDATDTLVASSGTLVFGIENKPIRLSLELTQNGANIDWRISALEVGQDTGGYVSSTINSQTFGYVRAHQINPPGSSGLGDSVVVGHVMIHNQVTDFWELHDQIDAYVGETAGARLARLCSEENVEFTFFGRKDDTVAMGAQLPDTLLSLLRECELADGGMLMEPRDFLGLGYRTRASMYAQAPTVTIPYGSLTELGPVEDDESTRNSITVARKNGSEYTATLESGALSVQPPPDGIGTYAESVTINVEDDQTLEHQAGWRLNLGTVDEPRFPGIQIGLEHSSIAGDDVLTAQIRSLDIGDRFVVSDPPAWMPPEDIEQINQGTVETLGVYEHELVIHSAPASPWDVLVWDSGDRYDSADSYVSSAATSSATSISVLSDTGALWTSDAGELPFDVMVGGEVMRVTAVSGTGPQTFTVTRHVNGITKSHAVGTSVRVHDSVKWGL